MAGGTDSSTNLGRRKRFGVKEKRFVTDVEDDASDSRYWTMMQNAHQTRAIAPH